MDPPICSNFGMISFPVEGSIGGKISNAAKTVAMVNQLLASAKNRPGHALVRYQRLIYHISSLHAAYLRPKPNTKTDGSSGLKVFRTGTCSFSFTRRLERKRSGLNLSGSGK